MNRTLSNIAFSLFMAMQANCVIKEPLKGSPICSYEPIEEPDEEKAERLGDVQCNELIPGHNNSFENRINIVFVGANYEPGHFNESIRKITDCNRTNRGILSQPVISENMNRFNFWYSSQIQNLSRHGEIYYNGESPNESTSLAEIARNTARRCNGENQILNNVAPILVTSEKFRSYAGYSQLINYNIDHENYSKLFYLKNNLIERGIDEPTCQDFSASCHLLDINEDGNFTEDDLEYQRTYTPNEIQEMCLTLHTDEECSNLNRNEILSDYNLAAQHYGFRLCQVLSEVSNESTIYPSDYLCQAMLGNVPSLGSAIISSRGSKAKSAAHEIGHSIACLRDEYVENTKDHINLYRNELESNGVNCFIGTYQECMQNSNWGHLENTDCYEGCNYVRYGVYRPTENSIMRNSDSEGYGPYNEERFCKMIKLLTGNADGICQNYFNNEEIE